MNSRRSARENARHAVIMQVPGVAPGGGLAGTFVPGGDVNEFPVPRTTPHRDRVLRDPTSSFLDTVATSKRKTAMPLVRHDMDRNVGAPVMQQQQPPLATRMMGRPDQMPW